MAARVVLATRLYPPEVAAAAFRLRALARCLTARGAQVTVLTTRPPRAPTREPEPDAAVDVRHWPVLRDRQGNVRGYLQYASFDVPLLLRLLTARRPDVVVAEPPPTTGLVVAMVCRLRRLPYVYYCADVWSQGAVAARANRVVIAVLRRVERTVLWRAAAVLAVSEPVAAAAEDLGADRARITVVGNGVDVGTFRPDGPRPPSTEGDYFVYTGTMSEWQGPEVFLEALRLLLAAHPGVRVVFLGQGSRVPRLRALAATLPAGAVEMAGVVPPAQAACWLRGARAALVSIVPGLGYDFAEPTKIYAATGCGTPVIFAGPGASRSVVERHRLGWAVPHAAAPVAAAMVEALQPHPDSRFAHLPAWTAQHASLEARAARAADVVLACSRGPEKPA
jgi:glycosyltransferase involved in cell wall biosynthesis